MQLNIDPETSPNLGMEGGSGTGSKKKLYLGLQLKPQLKLPHGKATGNNFGRETGSTPKWNYNWDGTTALN